ncbi:MAG: PIN domain-containing protein [Actinobacteria bacterium]|jgi:predicted nucleic acid-binding protein|nr:PIN domain-containing protein [Actinomycetota bacterium]
MATYRPKLVIDSCVAGDIIDVGLKARLPFERKRDTKRVLALLGTPLEFHGEVTSIEVVLSEHILGEVKHFLAREERLPNGALVRPGLSVPDTERQVKGVIKLLLDAGAHPDPTEEDYDELGRRSWYRGGTGKWDEAVLACAERHGAAILTRDQKFHKYVQERTNVQAWYPHEFVEKLSRLVRVR